MNLSNVLQWIDFVNLGLELTRLEHAKELIGIILELLACLDIPEESGTSDLDALGGEFPGSNQPPLFTHENQKKVNIRKRKWRHRSTSIAKPGNSTLTLHGL